MYAYEWCEQTKADAVPSSNCEQLRELPSSSHEDLRRVGSHDNLEYSVLYHRFRLT
ncbi:uncharacterized protein LOC131226807, partial [Magnolia sinica]|uniref:uncharacterized protein LOC131226807 n=1 Tax=Magnolia sinica TaxID=86752 RepID=UPI00265AFA60